ncbi:MAG: TetR/AcrR family transcriptional regulator [Gammaproteobacteria bacterium]|nr:TetR/AcrR family transcriptional regulator [Gammaproteobacteria bacterium]
MGLPKGGVTHSIESLTEISIDLFMERGYNGTSVGEIAKVAGITKSAIYHHVSSKEELLKIALGRALDQLFAMLGEPGAWEGSPLRRLEYLIRRLVETEVTHLREIALLQRVRNTTETARWARDRLREFDQHILSLIVDAQEVGEIRNDIDAVAINRLVFGMLNNITEWYHPKHAISPEALVKAVVALIRDGISGPRVSPDE